MLPGSHPAQDESAPSEEGVKGLVVARSLVCTRTLVVTSSLRSLTSTIGNFAVRTIFASVSSTQTEPSCVAVHARIGRSVRLGARAAVGADGVAGGRADQTVGEDAGGARCCRSPTDFSYCASSTGPRLSSAVRSGCAVRAAARSGERESTSSTGRAGRCASSGILASQAARQTLTCARSRHCSSRTRDARVCLCSTVLPRLAVCAAARSGAGSRSSGTTFTCRSVFNRRFPARAYAAAARVGA